MRAGDLNEVFTLYNRSVSRTEYGEDKETWTAGSNYRCTVAANTGMITDEAGIEQMYSAALVFYCRQYVGVTYGDRLLWRGKYYNVLSVIPDRRKIMQTIKAELIDE
jgi:head-tail adaptor